MAARLENLKPPVQCRNANLSDFPLQVIDPTKRLGCKEMGGYGPLKAHPFFEGVDWDGLEKQKPPELMPYLPPAKGTDTGYWGQYKVRLVFVSHVFWEEKQISKHSLYQYASH